MNKVILTAVIIAAASLSVMEANHIATTNVSNLKFDDIEAVAQTNPEDTPSDGEIVRYYDRYVIKNWYGYTTGFDGHLHRAHFSDWGCKPGCTLESCSPYIEVIICD